MASRIAAFLAATMDRPFAWGSCDCLIWPADMVRDLAGFDPAEAFRGTYASGFGCRRILMMHGGMATLCRAALSPLKTGERHNGVAVVRIGTQQHGAVLSGGRAFVKTEAGVWSPERFALIEGWTV